MRYRYGWALPRRRWRAPGDDARRYDTLRVLYVWLWLDVWCARVPVGRARAVGGVVGRRGCSCTNGRAQLGCAERMSSFYGSQGLDLLKSVTGVCVCVYVHARGSALCAGAARSGAGHLACKCRRLRAVGTLARDAARAPQRLCASPSMIYSTARRWRSRRRLPMAWCGLAVAPREGLRR